MVRQCRPFTFDGKNKQYGNHLFVALYPESCHYMYVFGIELSYSRCQPRLRPGILTCVSINISPSAQTQNNSPQIAAARVINYFRHISNVIRRLFYIEWVRIRLLTKLVTIINNIVEHVDVARHKEISSDFNLLPHINKVKRITWNNEWACP